MYLKEWAPEGYGLDWRTERFVAGNERGGRRERGYDSGKERERAERRERKKERVRDEAGGRLRRSRKYSRMDIASFKWWR